MKRLPKLITVSVLSALLLTPALAGQGKGPTKPFYQAVATGDIDEVKLHLDQGTDLVNKPDTNGNTPLGMAVEGGRPELIALLLEAGANPSAPSRDVPPIIMAAIRNNLDALKTLIERGAPVNGTDSMGKTALIVATDSGFIDIVEFLISAGANVNAKDKAGQSALAIAQARRQTEIADMLRRHGAEEPVNPFDASPYGSRGLRTPPGTASALESDAADGYQPADTAAVVLSDPNEIRARIASFPGLSDAIAKLDTASSSEQRNWRQRRMDNRTLLIRSVEKQFNDEMTFTRQIALSEKAVKTAAAIDQLVARRKARYAVISDDLREERRAAMMEQRQATTRTRMSARSRGRGAAAEPMGGGMLNDPYATAPGRPTPRTRPTTEVNEPPLDPVTEQQLQAWLAVDPLDKRDLLPTVHALDLREYDALRQTAVEEPAPKTAAAIEGLMLARQNRLAEINVKMLEDDERLQRIEERMGATTTPGGTRTRGMRGGTETDTPTMPRRGRRY